MSAEITCVTGVTVHTRGSGDNRGSLCPHGSFGNGVRVVGGKGGGRAARYESLQGRGLVLRVCQFHV